MKSHIVLNEEIPDTTSEVKKKISITIESDLLEWIDNLVNKVEYRSRSHVFEIAVSKLKEKVEKEV